MKTSNTEDSVGQKRLGTLIGIAARQWRRAIDGRLQEFDLTEATWMPLLQLARAEQPLRQMDIAAALSLDKSSVVRVLSNLEAAGLIAREANEEDRRAKAVIITPAGRDLVRRLEHTSEGLERELLAGLPPTDIAAARRTLEHVCRMLLQLNERAGR